MNTTQVSVDLAKAVFQVAVSHTPGRVDREHRLSRAGFRRFFAGHEPVQVWMEACGTAHHWGRELEAMGHEVSLLSPFVASRYRDGSKTDRADTKALLEAARNKKIRPVPVKSVEQQAVTALHRLRSGYLATRTARINAVRGHLREFDVSIPVGARHVVPRARAALEEDAVPDFLRRALFEALEEIGDLHEKGRVDPQGDRATGRAHAGRPELDDRARDRDPDRHRARRLRRRAASRSTATATSACC